jgi:hypothetical protein
MISSDNTWSRKYPWQPSHVHCLQKFATIFLFHELWYRGLISARLFQGHYISTNCELIDQWTMIICYRVYRPEQLSKSLFILWLGANLKLTFSYVGLTGIWNYRQTLGRWT